MDEEDFRAKIRAIYLPCNVTEDGRESEVDLLCTAVQVKLNMFIC